MSSLTFTLVQTDLRWEDKEANRQMLEEKILSLSTPTHVVVLPEMFSTGFSMKPAELAEPMDGPTVRWMKRLANERRVVLAGSLIVEEDKKYYNRFVWMLPNGRYGRYNKRHLFAYAGEHEHYTPGNERFIASVNGWKINLMICYDLRFPVWARQQFQKDGDFEYDVLVYVANWPERRAHAWKTLLVARAIENQCYVIGVNRVGNDGNGIYHSGDSMVVGPDGAVLYHKAHDEDLFTITLEKSHLDHIREKMPFWQDADPFLMLEVPGSL
ncbi:amidohydrolase [Paraflavisolibacter sp. H34]|uniref:amidohydrolase n=1 Tax=Huijunlia imazamoxiresistens TaxID=3127457 RepID=UPI003015BB7D